MKLTIDRNPYYPYKKMQMNEVGYYLRLHFFLKFDKKIKKIFIQPNINEFAVTITDGKTLSISSLLGDKIMILRVNSMFPKLTSKLSNLRNYEIWNSLGSHKITQFSFIAGPDYFRLDVLTKKGKYYAYYYEYSTEDFKK